MNLSPETQKLVQSIVETGYSFAFASVQAEYAMALEGLLPEYTILTTPEPWWMERVKEKGISTVVSKARATNTLDLLLSEEVRTFFKKTSSCALVLFKGGFQIESIARDLGVRLLAPSSGVSRRMENKLHLRNLVEGLSVPIVPQKEILCTREGYEEAKSLFGLPFVLQFAKGFAGTTSFLIHDFQDFEKRLDEKIYKVAKASQWKEKGISLTLNGCVLGKGIALSHPFVQLTGLPELTPRRLASCGGDFDTSFVPEEVLQKIEGMALQMGERLKKEGFLGYFGLDLLWVPEEGVYLIEINPRFTGSLNLFTKRQMALGEVPLILLHIAEFLGLQPEVPEKVFSSSSIFPTQMILHSSSHAPYILEQKVRPGIYSLSDFTFLREGHSFLDLRGKEEFFWNPLPEGTFITFGKETGRIVFPSSLAPQGCLSKEALSVIQWIEKERDLSLRKSA